MNKNIWISKQAVDHYIESPRFIEREAKIVNHFKGKVLDIGCGTGRTTETLRRMGFNVIGIDYSKPMIDKAKELYSECKFEVMDATNLTFLSESFDSILFSFNGIDYISSEFERKKALNEINRVLKPSGIFAFSSHNSWTLPLRKSRWETWKRTWKKYIKQYMQYGFSTGFFSPFRIIKVPFGELLTYHASYWKQKKNLKIIGFKEISYMGGKKFNLLPLSIFLDPYIYFIAKKVDSSSLIS